MIVKEKIQKRLSLMDAAHMAARTFSDCESEKTII